MARLMLEENVALLYNLQDQWTDLKTFRVLNHESGFFHMGEPDRSGL